MSCAQPLCIAPLSAPCIDRIKKVDGCRMSKAHPESWTSVCTQNATLHHTTVLTFSLLAH